MNSELKKGLLVVSFGTLHRESCEKTIGAIEKTLAERFPDRRLYRAFSSGFIVKKLKTRDNMSCFLPQEALEQMAEGGITDVLVQPVYLTDGFENRQLNYTLLKYKGRFKYLKVGQPLLATEKDLESVAETILMDILPSCVHDDGQIMILMGHGTAGEPDVNETYLKLQQAIRRKDGNRTHIGLVEGHPGIEEVISHIKETGGCTSAILTPLMIVAGNHATRDMAGGGEDSWANRMRAAGMEAVPVLKGLGEYKAIRDIFAEHAAEAERI